MKKYAPASLHLVARKADFDWATFERLVATPSDIRLVWEAFVFRPVVFNNLKNALNGLEFGYGFPTDRVKLVFAPHGPSNAYNYDDHVWTKYRIGDVLDLRDAKGERIAANPLLTPAALPSGAPDPDAEDGYFQDKSIPALQNRGVVFLACCTAVQEQARLIKAGGFADAAMSAIDISDDILAHLVTGAHLVPSMVATVAVLQQKYGYSYLTIDF